MDQPLLDQLARRIKQWASELGFQKTGISDIDLSNAEKHLSSWLERDFHGDMEYMQRHGSKRTHPEQLVENTCRVISCRMDYLPEEDINPKELLEQPAQAFVSRYALGRDYHKLLRKRLQQLVNRINKEIETRFDKSHNFRVFVDSAPVMEKALAEKAGLGWIGKHTNLLDRDAGSWFFLGEIYTSLPLPTDEAVASHCGDCTACIDICPTQAIVAPYQLDARRCISYLTIELSDSIPVEFRKAMGNRIYGCDDCQQVCPWNRFAKVSYEEDFMPRQQLDQSTLLELFEWDENSFLKKTEGSAIRRIGYFKWLRNIAIALGNQEKTPEVIKALQRKKSQTASEMVSEHIDWALQQHDQSL
ncbi:MAG: tRNA epoxyqueuosine(34) reductase QueG [Gammaproteobacteria bacterium]|nr:tRNA epoxyqueuosine(34) reductase QueG [Gammaproteobacteria bacterium]NNJ91801.1 tRNA epoxyqueuosine(34) reductase QueG [Gammaproteobacteria bacterium]